jgi:PAS domain S-box-containing protein
VKYLDGRAGEGNHMQLNGGLNPNDPEFFELLTGSFRRLVGRALVPKERGPEWLYSDAPFVVLAHNTAPSPVFVYANGAAQRRFGYSWSEFVKLESRLSAGPSERGERQALLDAVAQNGYMAGYRGLRVTKSGSRFWMENGVVWQLRDENGQDFGQAATFSEWADAAAS